MEQQRSQTFLMHENTWRPQRADRGRSGLPQSCEIMRAVFRFRWFRSAHSARQSARSPRAAIGAANIVPHHDQWRYALNVANGRPGTSRSWTITDDDAMSIKREDLDAGRIDFADVSIGKRLPLIHPGEILRDDFLQA